MSAFPESGRSDRQQSTEYWVRFAPAEVIEQRAARTLCQEFPETLASDWLLPPIRARLHKSAMLLVGPLLEGYPGTRIQTDNIDFDTTSLTC